MTVSPGSSRAANWSSVDCTTPAGSISQTLLGFSSLSTRSWREEAAVALLLQFLYGLPVEVVDDTAMAVTHQPAHEIGAHPAEPDHAELHGCVGGHGRLPVLQSAVVTDDCVGGRAVAGLRLLGDAVMSSPSAVTAPAPVRPRLPAGVNPYFVNTSGTPASAELFGRTEALRVPEPTSGISAFRSGSWTYFMSAFLLPWDDAQPIP